MSTTAKNTCVLLLLLFTGGTSATTAVYASAPLVLDGIGTCTGSLSLQSAACDAQLLTTTKGDDVIVMVAECGIDHVAEECTISSITDSSGLTFIQRISYAHNMRLWEYYARAKAPLRSDNITAVFSAQPHGMQVLAIHGANTRAIFDPNPSIPATVACPGPDCGNCTFALGTCSATIQTSTTDFVIATTAINDGPPCGGYHGYFGGVPGFTTLTTNAGESEVDYAIASVAESRVVFSCNGTFATAIVVDAISFRGAFGVG